MGLKKESLKSNKYFYKDRLKYFPSMYFSIRHTPSEIFIEQAIQTWSPVQSSC